MVHGASCCVGTGLGACLRDQPPMHPLQPKPYLGPLLQVCHLDELPGLRRRGPGSGRHRHLLVPLVGPGRQAAAAAAAQGEGGGAAVHATTCWGRGWHCNTRCGQQPGAQESPSHGYTSYHITSHHITCGASRYRTAVTSEGHMSMHPHAVGPTPPASCCPRPPPHPPARLLTCAWCPLAAPPSRGRRQCRRRPPRCRS